MRFFGLLKQSAVAAAVMALLIPAAWAQAGIQWLGTWDAATREAARTGRPILLVSAAPHCHEVPGIW